MLTLLGQSSNSMNTLSQTAESTYNPTQMQEVLNKLDVHRGEDDRDDGTV